MIVAIAELFCLQVALGTVLALFLVRISDMEWKFFRLNIVIVSVLLALGYLLHRPAPGSNFFGLWGASESVLGAKILALISGGFACGVTLVAMNVGHWYLSATKLSIRPLRSVTLGLAVVLSFRLIWLALMVPILARTTPQVEMDLGRFLRLEEMTLMTIGITRILFGLVGPLLLTYLTWQSVKIHSTQSATGILYALLAMILVGEACATFITLTTSIPA